MSQIPILELKTLSDSRALVRICHNHNHLILIEQSFDYQTHEWSDKVDSSFNLPLSFVKPIWDYCKKHDSYNKLESPEKETVETSPSVFALNHSNQPRLNVSEQKPKQYTKATRKLFKAADDIDCLIGAPNYEHACLLEDFNNAYWEISSSPETAGSPLVTPKAVLPSEKEIPETPEIAKCYAPAAKRQKKNLRDQSPRLFD